MAFLILFAASTWTQRVPANVRHGSDFIIDRLRVFELSELL
jgi:hypothetical protein